MDAEISSRLPAIVAFLAMLLCVFEFVRRRYAAVYAFAVVLLLMTYPFLAFAVFAKSYSSEMAGIAFAMICWQGAMAGKRHGWNALGVWFGLALAIYSHTFAVFLFIPFAAAQGWSDARRRQVDWPMWAALVLFPAALLPVVRGDLMASKLYGSNFWSQPSSALMKQTYIDYFAENWRFLLILLAAALVVSSMLRSQGPVEDRTGRQGREGSRSRSGCSCCCWRCCRFTCCRRRICCMLTVRITCLCMRSGSRWCWCADLLSGADAGDGGSCCAGAVCAGDVEGGSEDDSGRAAGDAASREVHARLQAEYVSQPWVKLLEGSDLAVLAGDHLLYTRLDAMRLPSCDSGCIF